jgi:hypothetical protein
VSDYHNTFLPITDMLLQLAQLTVSSLNNAMLKPMQCLDSQSHGLNIFLYKGTHVMLRSEPGLQRGPVLLPSLDPA